MMRRYSVSDLSDRLITYGRTFVEPKEDILFFNWSCSTVEFLFSGTHLNVSFRADCGYEFEGLPTDPNSPKRPTWPWVAVFLDDMPMPIRKFEVASPNETWLLYQSRKPETHRIRLTKLTENSKTFLGIAAFTAEGEFLPLEKKPARRMEIVGDSITCGYGNLVKEPTRHFFSSDEDAWQSYGALAARQLGFEWSCVSISGITAVRHPGWPGDYAMEELYGYTDRVCQTKLGMEPERWDFAKNHNDYVVVNLGTNDCFGILFSEAEGELERFTDAYLAFLREIRAANGPETRIVCALGTMNYYLYHDIVRAVEKFRRETGDSRVWTLRLRPIHPLDGLGADGHPALETHKKMADELAAFLKTLD